MRKENAFELSVKHLERWTKKSIKSQIRDTCQAGEFDTSVFIPDLVKDSIETWIEGKGYRKGATKAEKDGYMRNIFWDEKNEVF